MQQESMLCDAASHQYKLKTKQLERQIKKLAKRGTQSINDLDKLFEHQYSIKKVRDTLAKNTRMAKKNQSWDLQQKEKPSLFVQRSKPTTIPNARIHA